ncbi:hypothetical protein GCM10023116_33570 [Kistimonas scapharcae]|uniref:Pentapeptide repeat-containing protein n=1 Tax=Kistimonas scapharcae TaxID=1036133 RepID=A0ABP8V6N2_9GAMM
MNDNELEIRLNTLRERIKNQKTKGVEPVTDSQPPQTFHGDITPGCCITHQDLSRTHWQSVRASDLNLSHCTFRNVDFTGAELEGLHATHCHFEHCRFRSADLTASRFEHCTFYHGDEHQRCDFSFCNLKEAQFTECDLSFCSFSRADAYGIEIDHCRAQGCDFSLASFSRMLSRKTAIALATITNTNLAYSDFEGVVLDKCELPNNRWIGVNFTNANLEGANLCGGTMSFEHCHGLSLASADLRNTELHGLDLRQVNLQGVKILEWQQQSLLESLGLIIFPD